MRKAVVAGCRVKMGSLARDSLYRITRNGKVIFDGKWVSFSYIGQFQKISIPSHGRLPYFNPPLPSEIPKCVTSPCPQNSIIVNPPSPSEIPFFLEVHFRLSNAHMNKRTRIMPPQGCDLAVPGDKLYSSATRKTYR